MAAKVWVTLACEASSAESPSLRIANEEGALVGLVNCLSKHEGPHSQLCVVSIALSHDWNGLMILKAMQDFLQALRSLLGDDILQITQHIAAQAFVKIDPTQAREARLHSGEAFKSRGEACISMKMYVEALADLHQAIELDGAAGCETLRYMNVTLLSNTTLDCIHRYRNIEKKFKNVSSK